MVFVKGIRTSLRNEVSNLFQALLYAPLEGMAGEDFLSKIYRDRLGCFASSRHMVQRSVGKDQKV